MAVSKQNKEEQTSVEEAPESTEMVPTSAAGGAVVVSRDQMSDQDMLLADAAQGGENIGMQHLTIPFFATLQQLSPQVQKGGPKYIKGAEAGMIMNTLTGRVFGANVAEPDKGRGILVAACHFDPKDIEWKPRGQSGGGGGLVKVWGHDKSYEKSPDYQFSEERRRWISREGNEVMNHFDTYIQQVGYFDAEDELELEVAQGILSAKGSQIKKARAWNSERSMRRIQVSGRTIQPPHWYDTYRIQTRFEQNDKGSWFGLEVSRYKPMLELPQGRDLYVMAKETYEGIQNGVLHADETGRESDGLSAGTGGEIPF